MCPPSVVFKRSVRTRAFAFGVRPTISHDVLAVFEAKAWKFGYDFKNAARLVDRGVDQDRPPLRVSYQVLWVNTVIVVALAKLNAKEP